MLSTLAKRSCQPCVTFCPRPIHDKRFSTCTPNYKPIDTTTRPTTTERAKDIVDYVGDKAKAATDAAKYQAHVSQVKNSDLPITDRVKGGVKAVGDKVSEVFHETKADAHMSRANQPQAQNPDMTITDKMKGGAKAVGDKVSGVFHETKAKADSNLNNINQTNPQQTTTDKVKEGLNYADDKAKAANSAANYQANSADAQNSDLPIKERIMSGVKAVGNKIGEVFSDKKAESQQSNMKQPEL